MKPAFRFGCSIFSVIKSQSAFGFCNTILSLQYYLVDSPHRQIILDFRIRRLCAQAVVCKQRHCINIVQEGSVKRLGFLYSLRKKGSKRVLRLSAQDHPFWFQVEPFLGSLLNHLWKEFCSICNPKKFNMEPKGYFKEFSYGDSRRTFLGCFLKVYSISFFM